MRVFSLCAYGVIIYIYDMLCSASVFSAMSPRVSSNVQLAVIRSCPASVSSETGSWPVRKPEGSITCFACVSCVLFRDPEKARTSMICSVLQQLSTVYEQRSRPAVPRVVVPCWARSVRLAPQLKSNTGTTMSILPSSPNRAVAVAVAAVATPVRPKIDIRRQHLLSPRHRLQICLDVS